MTSEISQWFSMGCDLMTGVALYHRFGTNDNFKVLLSVNPAKYTERLRAALALLIGITPSADVNRAVEQDRFRARYPFLGDKHCPRELKLLANDKITAYWNYVHLHDKLYDCVTNTECLNTASALLDNFIENDTITREFRHYAEHKAVLGKHSIFNEYRKTDAVRKMSVKELIRRQEQLKENIWRIKNEIAKGDKPHLTFERERRQEERERELELVNRLLDE
ncbi:MAG: hypothetical protein ACRDDZ_05870 [Marinifilaceae bacterium]